MIIDDYHRLICWLEFSPPRTTILSRVSLATWPISEQSSAFTTLLKYFPDSLINTLNSISCLSVYLKSATRRSSSKIVFNIVTSRLKKISKVQSAIIGIKIIRLHQPWVYLEKHQMTLPVLLSPAVDDYYHSSLDCFGYCRCQSNHRISSLEFHDGPTLLCHVVLFAILWNQ